jgi:cytochrome c-type biogenesis protein CcmH/NrfF
MRRRGAVMSGRAGLAGWIVGLQLAVALGLPLGIAGLPGAAAAANPAEARSEFEIDEVETGAELEIEWAYALAHELMSPFCPGRTLAECSSPQAAELRLWILTQAAAGASQEEIEANLYGRFGDVLLAAPRAEGWGLWAYLVPIFFFVIGGPVVVWIIRNLTGGSGGDGGSPTASGGSGASEAPTRFESAGDPEVRKAALVAAAPGGDAELERLVDQELGGG